MNLNRFSVLDDPISPESTSTQSPTVFIVDDDEMTLNVLQRLVTSAGLHAVTCESASDCLQRCSPGQRGCLVLDLCLPEMDGLSLQRELRARKIELPIIFLSGFGNVSVAVQALKADAFDFVEKPYDSDLLLQRIREAIAHDARVQRVVEEKSRTALRLSKLTPREREIMELVVQGFSNKRMANHLGISEKTVEAHRSNLKRKLGIDGVVELVRMALVVAQ